jgi:xylan 1,4-beta-xylosidase
VKSVDPTYKVGGPATAGAAWEPEMIEFCVKNEVPIDFISTHSYGVKEGFLDEYGGHGTVLNPDYWSLSKDVIDSRKEISDSKLKNLELHYTEWSASYTPADPIHDSYHEAAYILQKLKQVGNAAQSMSYWVFTDIFEEPGPRFTPFHGGFGLLNTQGIKKSAFFAYSFMNQLGETELVNADSLSWASKTKNNDVQILFWDFTYTLPDSVNNQDYYSTNVPSKDKGSVQLDLTGMEKGNYKLEIFQVGYGVNDPYTAYLDMNEPNQLTKQQVADLNSKSTGEAILNETISINKSGQFKREIAIRENDVFLVRLKKLL